MANFDDAIQIILKSEGGYVNDPDDPGGETNMGITKRDFPQLDIVNLIVEQAKEIYKEKYWDSVKGNQISNQKVANQIFDFGVNAGTKRSIKKAQEVLKETFNVMVVDGIIGNQTVGTLNSFDSDLFVVKFKLKRIEYYTAIAKKASLRKFLYSWVKRTLET